MAVIEKGTAFIQKGVSATGTERSAVGSWPVMDSPATPFVMDTGAWRHATASNAETVTLILDSDWRIRFFAGSAPSIFNLIGADIGRPIFEVLELTRDENLIAETGAALRQAMPVRQEIIGSNGHVYFCSITAGGVPGTDENGFIISYTDVSGIRAAGDRVEAALSYAHSIIEALPQIFVILDRNLVIFSASKSFYERFQLTPDALIGQKITDIDNGRFDLVSLREFYDGLRSQEVKLVAADVAIVAPDDTSETLTFAANALSGVPGQAQQILLSIRPSSPSDVTSTPTQGEKAAAITAKRFLATADHDLREPLQRMFVVHEMLKQKNQLAPGGDDLVDQLEHATEEMSYLLNALLTINQLEAGLIELDAVEFPVADTFEQIRAEFERYADEKSVDFRIICSSALIRTDQHLFWQALRNLLWSTFLQPKRPRQVLLGCRRIENGGTCIQVWARGSDGDSFSKLLSTTSSEYPPSEEQWSRWSQIPGKDVIAHLCRLLDVSFEIRHHQDGATVCTFDFPSAGAALPAEAALPVGHNTDYCNTGHGQLPQQAPGEQGPVDEKLIGGVDKLSLIERSVARGEDALAAAEKLETLTPRQYTIASLVAEGHANKEIAHRLGISQRTVENHRSEMMSRLGVRSIAELVRLVVIAGG